MNSNQYCDTNHCDTPKTTVTKTSSFDSRIYHVDIPINTRQRKPGDKTTVRLITCFSEQSAANHIRLFVHHTVPSFYTTTPGGVVHHSFSEVPSLVSPDRSRILFEVEAKCKLCVAGSDLMQ